MENSPVEELFPLIAKASQEWVAKHTYEVIKQSVHKKLDISSEEIVLKLLGFDSDYKNSYTLDHCNGRGGNSIAGDYLGRAQAEAIKEWLGTIRIPVLSNELRKSIEKEMQQRFDQEIQRCVWKAVENAINKQVKELTDSISTTDIVQKYQDSLKLIQGN